MNLEMSRLSRMMVILPNRKHVLAVAFVIVISAPGITSFFTPGGEDIREREFRNAAEFPELFVKHVGPIPRPSKSSLRRFPPQFERWFNDHRGLRRPLLGLHSHARLAGLVGSGMAQSSIAHKGSNGVLVGNEGWLFLANDATMRDYQRSRPLTLDELETWKHALIARRDWFAERGIAYLVVIAPNKGEIYPEHLPRALKSAGGIRRLDQIVEHCGAEDGVEIVDLRGPLLAMKTKYRLYDKTDTHWNGLGAFVGYHAIMKAVAEKLKGRPALPLESYRIEEGAFQVKDLGRLLGGSVTEQGLELKPLHLPSWQMAQTAKHSEGRVILATNPQADRPNIVVLHDSFMRALTGFLNEHFQRVCYKRRVNSRGALPFPAELIEQERPAMVIEEMVQRRLQQTPLILPPAGGAVASRPGRSVSARR